MLATEESLLKAPKVSASFKETKIYSYNTERLETLVVNYEPNKYVVEKAHVFLS